MATFGTKSMGGDSVSGSEGAGSGDSGGQGSGHGNGSTSLDVTDTAWKDGLRAGHLVDAQDSSGVWYQVRTLFWRSLLEPVQLPMLWIGSK